MKKIEALNSLEVIGYSASFGELEYVLAENSEKNREVLIAGGFTEEQVFEACDGGVTDIDLSYLAFNCTKANCWYKDSGFREENA